MLGSKVLFLLMILAENRKACSSALITWVLGPSVYSKIPPGRQERGRSELGEAGFIPWCHKDKKSPGWTRDICQLNKDTSPSE